MQGKRVYHALMLAGCLLALLVFGAGKTSSQMTAERSQLEWQLNRLLQRSLASDQRAEPEIRTLAGQLAAHTAQLFETLPKGQPIVERERRTSSPAWFAQAPRSNQLNMDTLNAIGSLNSLLEPTEMGASRLSRAYKPRTMSTARGFGK